jgi:hypothetical protein
VAEGVVPGAMVTALELAALALGRLDAAVAAHPLRRAWSFWAELDAARRHAATDGRKVDVYRLAAHLHGLPLTLNRGLSPAERGQEIASLNYAVGLRSWMAAPDAEQSGLRDAALDTLRAHGRDQPALLAAARGLRAWVAGQGSRPAGRAAVPLYLHERQAVLHRLPAVTGDAALTTGAFDPDGFTVRFLHAVAREADDGRDLLRTMEREWHAARGRVDRRAGGRSTSSLPTAVDLLAASPLLSVSALARAVGCSTEGASKMLDALVQLEVVAEVTGLSGRGARRLYGLTRLLPIRAETTAARRRPKGGPRGRPKRIRTAPCAALPAEPYGPTVAPVPVDPLRHAPVTFDFDALDRLTAVMDEQTRRVRRLLDRISRGETPFSGAETLEAEPGET